MSRALRTTVRYDQLTETEVDTILHLCDLGLRQHPEMEIPKIDIQALLNQDFPAPSDDEKTEEKSKPVRLSRSVQRTRLHMLELAATMREDPYEL